MATKILVFAGSARKDSVNKKLAKSAADAVRSSGAEATFIDLADYPAPIYDGDFEAEHGLPQTVRDFKELIASHDGMLVVTPEYNGSLTPLLVNMFAWASRAEADGSKGGIMAGKRVALAAASPGALGGVRVIPRLRDFLAELGVMAVPGFVTLPKAFEAFDADGKLTSEHTAKQLEDLASRLISALK